MQQQALGALPGSNAPQRPSDEAADQPTSRPKRVLLNRSCPARRCSQRNNHEKPSEGERGSGLIKGSAPLLDLFNKSSSSWVASDDTELANSRIPPGLSVAQVPGTRLQAPLILYVETLGIYKDAWRLTLPTSRSTNSPPLYILRENCIKRIFQFIDLDLSASATSPITRRYSLAGILSNGQESTIHRNEDPLGTRQFFGSDTTISCEVTARIDNRLVRFSEGRICIMSGGGQGGRGGKDGRGRGHARGGGAAGYGAGQGGGRGQPPRGPGAGGGPGGDRAGFPPPQRGGYQQGRGQGGFRGGFGGGGARDGYNGDDNAPKIFSDSTDPNPQPDPAITKAENNYIESQKTTIGGLAKLAVSEAPFPQRPGYGTRGSPITLFANYFTLAITGQLKIYCYNFKLVEGTALGRKLKRLVHLLLRDPRLAGAATDYTSILYSTAPLPMPLEVPVQYVEEFENQPRPGNYKFLVAGEPIVHDVTGLVEDLRAISSQVDRNSRQAIVQALTTLMGTYPTSSPNTLTLAANRHYPHGPPNPSASWDLGGGLEALRGYFRSVRLATCRILYNVNVSHAVVYSAIGLDEMMSRFGTSDWRQLHKFLRRVRVKTNYLKDEKGNPITKVKTIAGLATKEDGRGLTHKPEMAADGSGPDDVRFYLSPEGEAGSGTSTGKAKATKSGGPPPTSSKGFLGPGYISVSEFFRTRHNRPPQRKDLPVVNVGTKDKPTYLPPEVCQVLPGQTTRKTINPTQTQAMIKRACRPPGANARSIKDHGTKVLGLEEPSNAFLVKNGITVVPKLIVAPGRVLPVPDVRYGERKSVKPTEGSWNMNRIKHHSAGRNTSWAWVWIQNTTHSNPFGRQPPIESFLAALLSYGVNIQPPVKGLPLVLDRRQGKEHIERELSTRVFSKLDTLPGKPGTLFVILPAQETTLYKVIKYLGDIRFGIQTICVMADKFFKGQPGYFANVALKFNLKAGGTNQVLDDGRLGVIGEGKTMVVGIDVTHPSPGSQDGAPSVAGMVASVDKSLGQWPAVLSVQAGRQEWVGALDSMLKSRLDLWRQKNQTLPENILVYRDGVSEGQYLMVRDTELPQLRKTCREKYPAPQTQKGLPRISIVVVGKRHHTRFYPTADQHGDKNGNPKNGTVVDRSITEAFSWDFFLQAHTCLQGTARPAHYFVVVDEIFRAKYDRRPPFPGGNTADALEDLTHNMCHLYGRASKTVSLCPPAYYADLVCERARCYLNAFDESASDNGGGPDITQMQNDVTIHQRLRNTMFYI
ncbi:MAG: hypothetical protein M1816_005557 [Peltula sp. TS41687]|nr:MAG: hypothetical protein M1816_005557 [Peltula sp. TS41687]